RRGRRRRHRQPHLPGALRHRARVRAGDAADRPAVGGDRGAARARRRHRRLVGRAAARHPDAPRPLTWFALAWRTASRHPGRSALAMAGVAIIGALLFDMLLLSRGLLDSFGQLLQSSGYDVRIVAHDGLAVARSPIHAASALVADLQRLPEVEAVTLVRFEDGVARAGGNRERDVVLVGTTSQEGRGAWRLLRGSDLAAASAADGCAVVVAHGVASRLQVEPGAEIEVRVTLPS